VGGLLPPTAPPSVVTATATNAPISAIGRSISSHVIKGYQQLEQEDDRSLTGSDSGEEEDVVGSTAESVDDLQDKDSDNEDFESDFGLHFHVKTVFQCLTNDMAI